MKKFILILFLVKATLGFTQPAPKPFGALPSKAQLNWHQMEMYCIIHFGVDTYTDKEWGFGDEDLKILNPVKFNAAQIVGAAKAGGFKGVVIVAKHHDGLCLWPSKTTEHNISNTAWKNGKGDMVKEYQLACLKLNMQMGVYCSPWDRNNPNYGKPGYLAIYQNQLRELYQNYGTLFVSWHDGANGGDGFYGGAREIRTIDRSTYYDWPNTWAITRKMQPSAVIFGDVGPDVRWVGNEEGHAGETCWATYNPQAPDAGKIPANGYVKDEEGTEGTLHGTHWMPAECDVSLRPGWFYHASQNNQVKSPYTLLNLYYKSVGRGANLDLGLSPNRNGLLDTEDVASLKQFGKILNQTFAVDLAKSAKLTASNIRGNNAAKYGPEFLLDNNRYTYWATDDKVTTPVLTLNLGTLKSFNVIRLRENIKLGQRIEAAEVDAFLAGEWVKIASVTSIGANRLIRLPQNITTGKVRLRITKSPVCIALSDFALYKEPTHVTVPIITRNKAGQVTIATDAPVEAIRYTVDGSDVTIKSPIYNAPIVLANGGLIKAIAIDGKQTSEQAMAQFGVSKQNWTVLPGTTGNNPKNAIDENNNSLWSTLPTDSVSSFVPAELRVDMGTAQNIAAFSYLPRQDKKSAGVVDQFVFLVSTDGATWQQVAGGEFANIKSNPIEQQVKLAQPVNARYFAFKALHVVSGNGITAAEIGITTQQ
ncbi:alpha-L-fucosidase [Mucilaginibacter gracilis]|uniref:alpha-L-fucosidase n=1 Tax=Mucilaginibacter gracilis TaxID=423350 RepID=A0A495J739_9SPHI|nr:alpha-L-fucosidase [Mucilaginibacter gracilis]RKR84541.1 alpha-L-fucosidase [Mucilaginibacter gracilis]